jgi:hypothetical protein
LSTGTDIFGSTVSKGHSGKEEQDLITQIRNNKAARIKAGGLLAPDVHPRAQYVIEGDLKRWQLLSIHIVSINCGFRFRYLMFLHEEFKSSIVNFLIRLVVFFSPVR